jgi:branched-chain amino acid transport system ATP-binding protein
VALLEARALTIRFGGHNAVTDVDLDVEPGCITGLIGPNGAGKTTIFNAITGLQEVSHGSLLLDGRDITNEQPQTRARLGIARTFQHLELFGSLTVRDNVRVAAEIRRRWARDLDDDVYAETEAILTRVGLPDVAGERADSLPTGLARLCELGRALAARPKLLLLDEPASGLNERETGAFADLLRELAAEGVAILLVEHDVELVMDVCRTINVIDYGVLIAVGAPAEVRHDPAVLDAYLGGAPARGAPLPPRVRTVTTQAAASSLPPLLELRNVSAAYGRIEVLHDIDLEVPVGNVVALLGPNGSGKSTLLKVASGRVAPRRGCVHLGGRHVNGARAEAMTRIGMCTIPEGQGVFPNLTVQENLVMATYAGFPQAVIEERAFARFPRLKERRTQLAGTLSGGEQRMLAMARALATEPALLLLDELSMGLAPLVVQELYELVGEIARAGVSILVVEQFANIVLSVADLSAVMMHGRITATGAPQEIETQLSSAYLGASA